MVPQCHIKRRTRLWKVLDWSFACFGKGDDGIEVDLESEFTAVFTILQDRTRDILLSGILLKNVKSEGGGAQDGILPMVVVVHKIQHQGLVKRIDEQEFGFRPGGIVTEILSAYSKELQI